MNTSSEMSLGAAPSSMPSLISSAPSLESPINDSHGPIKLWMDCNDPYIGFEDFPALEYPIQQGKRGDLVIEEGEKEEEEEGDEERPQCLKPCVGMEFGSTNEAYNFYNAYGGHIGFSIRKNTQTKSKHGVSSVRYVCSKEGFSKRQRAEQKGLGLGSSTNLKTPEREHGSTRTGCRASMRVKLVKEVVWQVSTFSDDHNHELILSPAKNRNLRSQKCLGAEEKKIIVNLSAQNVGTSQILEYIADKRGGKRKLTFKKKDVSNQIATQNRKIIGVDVETTLAYFRKKQEEDVEFFYAIDADKNGAVQHIFWIDGRARRVYLEFGDVVTFDTTYNTNRYSMPLAPFIGVNHHRHSIFFGMALLRSEKENNFTWLFETWLRAIYEKHPTTIITDQDPAMRVAIRKVFPNTIYRCCQWHVMRKAKEKFLTLYKLKPGFQEQLGSVINHSLTVSDFEKAWAAMLEMYEVNDNNHLKVMYAKRAEWVPAYFRGTFFAEMSTTQRSESMNAILKLWINNHTSIYQFVRKIESMVEGIWHKESDEDIKTMNEMPRLWSRYQIEQEARRVYTRSNFSVFKEILMKSTVGVVVERERDVLYEVVIRNLKVPENYIVEVDKGNERFSCNCKGFEFEGFLCQHAIKVLHHVGMEHLPSQYILKRWCKEANANAKRSIYDRSMDVGEFEALQAFRKATLRLGFKELEDLASDSSAAFKIVKSRIGDIISEVRLMVPDTFSKQLELPEARETVPQEEREEEDIVKESIYLDPPLSQCKGRKKRPARFKSIVETIKVQRRTCSYCQRVEAHDVRNCPKRKEDLAKGKK